MQMLGIARSCPVDGRYVLIQLWQWYFSILSPHTKMGTSTW
jgi:hypothetical protein